MQDMEYSDLRRVMVNSQIIARGIKDERVLNAMLKVPRHLFVPEENRNYAYDDMALRIGENQTISQPYMVAVMTELLELTGKEKVLEIGTGSGYQAAVLAELAGEVYTIERIDALSKSAQTLLNGLGYKNIHCITADGTLGWPDAAPFDRILITAAAPDLPDPHLSQLKDNGIIVAPVGTLYSQELIKARKIGTEIIKDYFTPCVFVPLIGKHGWQGGG